MSATGDAKLTMLQQVPLDGTIIVSTPQDMALINARRGIAMFHRGNVPVLGAVENMSTFICPKCGTRFDILGHGGARQEAERLGVPLLGGGAAGKVDARNLGHRLADRRNQPDSPPAQAHRAIAAMVRDQFSWGGHKTRAQDRDRGLSWAPAPSSRTTESSPILQPACSPCRPRAAFRAAIGPHRDCQRADRDPEGIPRKVEYKAWSFVKAVGEMHKPYRRPEAPVRAASRCPRQIAAIWRPRYGVTPQSMFVFIQGFA